MHVQCLGAAGRVTGSCHLVQAGDFRGGRDVGVVQAAVVPRVALDRLHDAVAGERRSHVDAQEQRCIEAGVARSPQL